MIVHCSLATTTLVQQQDPLLRILERRRQLGCVLLAQVELTHGKPVLSLEIIDCRAHEHERLRCSVCVNNPWFESQQHYARSASRPP